ncbi:MAG: hypothetical protein PVJ53_07785 [Desulfobacterales bacterium]
MMIEPNWSGRREEVNPASVFRFEYAHLREKGCAGLRCGATALMVTFRGTGMIDVFDSRDGRHVAFLDFDLRREIHLDSAFRSPYIGLPFTAALRGASSVYLHRFVDLRRDHHYGFFVEPGYRNKGRKKVWNLDELMMAIALAYADDQKALWFHIKPTGDTASYYRRKFRAVCLPTSATANIVSIRLGDARQPLPHVRRVRSAGRTRYLDLPTASDAAWQSA